MTLFQPDIQLKKTTGADHAIFIYYFLFGLYPVFNDIPSVLNENHGTGYLTPADIRLIATEVNIFFNEYNDNNEIHAITKDDGNTYYVISYSKKPHLSDLYHN